MQAVLHYGQHMKQSMTIIKLVYLWQSLKPRREALGLTQPQLAEALGISLSAYTHYEVSAEKLTVDRLMQLDGKISMLEKAAGNSVDNYVDKNGTKSAQALSNRIQDVLPKDLTPSSPNSGNVNPLTIDA